MGSVVVNDINNVIDASIKECNTQEVTDFLTDLRQYTKFSGESTDKSLIVSYQDTLCIHSINVAYISATLGVEEQTDSYFDIILSALLHDIGKLKVAQGLLVKKDALSKGELQCIRKHSYYGYNLLKNDSYIRSKPKVLKAVLQHHERLDGTGYPFQLTGESIEEIARIVAIADSYDAMISYRLYNSVESPLHALNELLKLSNQYDKKYVDKLVARFNSKARLF